ncbi:hcp [Scenedesmus sp. PABB004]|nr:hcp [Scenedesmus sp. PABB004]
MLPALVPSGACGPLAAALAAAAPALTAARQNLGLRAPARGISSIGSNGAPAPAGDRGSHAAPRPAGSRAGVMASPGASLRGFAAQPAVAESPMFCYQCEQTQDNKACTTVGVCGKTPEDLLIYSLKGLGGWAHLANEAGVPVPQHIQSFITGSTFSTLTNVNFDEARFTEMLQQAADYSAQLRAALKAKGVPDPAIPDPAELGWSGELPHPMTYDYPGAGDMALLRAQAKSAGVAPRREALGATLAGLQEMLAYGLKGMAAYTHHAEALGKTSGDAYAYINRALSFLASPAAKTPGEVLGMCMALGEANFGVMAMLSDGHKARFGTPTPTPVSLDPVEGKAILVTGHDMHDLSLLLEQTAGKGINVYTHGEMLPAHGYPELKKHKHLVGHFGGAWYRQKIDFSQFPGAVLATTNVRRGAASGRNSAAARLFSRAARTAPRHPPTPRARLPRPPPPLQCVLDPPKAYKDRLFTTNETGLSGVTHIGTAKDFSPVIAAALSAEGFTPDNMPDPDEVAEERAEEGRLGVVTVGFGHDAVLGVAGQVVDAVKTGKLEHIFVIGGCDGSEPQRKYYDRLARLMPQNTMVLTLGCGKFRIFNQDFGMLPGTGLPRLLDMGQCNDAYSALVVATELAKAFNTDVNGLPLSLDISWFEQKAVAVLLTLLHLGVRNIRLGPRLPGFLTPEAVTQLVEAFAIKPANTEDPAADLKLMMKGH